MTRLSASARLVAILAVFVAAAGSNLIAQSADTSPAFALFSDHVFSTREPVAIGLTFRRLDHLDLRVYRVTDPFTFFEKLKDPHQLGSEEPVVPQERTVLERIALWKSARRSDLRWLVRRQFSPEYRAERTVKQDAVKVVQRRTENVSTFAQVPLLNASQLVTSWREILPPVRDAEYRRLPLDLHAPGVYLVEAVNPPVRAYTIVVVSDIGVVTKTAPGQLLVFAANRFSGEPFARCRVRVLSDQKPMTEGATADDGTFVAEVTGRPDSLVTVAQCGQQMVASDPAAFSIREPARELVGYVYTDRPVYRPGHVVHLKGILRWREKGALLPFSREPVEVSVVDGSDKVLVRERKPVDEFGAVNGAITIPKTASLGLYTVRVASGESTATGSFEVQEYRKPEFDVAVRPASKFSVQGGRVMATIVARYYFGQPVAGASVKYVMHKQPYYSPLRSEGGDGETGEDNEDMGFFGGDEQVEGTARLNDQGTVEIAVPLKLDENARDYTARIEARVMDASSREVSGAASTVATYGRFMVVARADRYVHAAGDQASVTLRTVDYEGRAIPSARMHVELQRVQYKDGASTYATLQQSDLDTGADGRGSWPFTVPRAPGTYRVRATTPSDGRQMTDYAYLWVSGAQTSTAGDDQELELIADRRSYQPGETARVIARGAEFNSPVLVTKENQHVSFHRVVTARANEAIDVPIGEDDVGDTYVSIAFLKDDRLYRAEKRIGVPATAHQLTITAVADKNVVRPGEPGTFSIHVADASDRPVRAQLSLGLVDEALYGVRPDTTPDPLRFFYRREYSLVSTAFSRNYSFVGYSGTEQLLLARRRSPTTLADFKADRPDRPRVRKDFPDTVFWAGDVTSGADGNASIRVEYPDSLTTWRLTVRAVTVGTNVGAATARTLTTKDVILRVITPRFLTEGDQVSIPTIVHNYMPDAKPFSVSLKADGLSAADASASPDSARPLQVSSNGEQRVDWRFVANQVRPISVTGKATSDAASDAMEISLPVLPAGLQRHAGNSGSIVEAGERTLQLTVPPTANASARSVKVALAPSLAGTMLGALDFLTSYPWGCTEQTLSSFVPNLVVLRALSDMKIAPPERVAALDRQVGDGLKRLYDFQHDDGGWGWWKTDVNHPFMTAYALDGLLQARESNVRIDEYRLEIARRALQQLYAKYPRAIPDLKAYEIYVLARAEENRDARGERDAFDIGAAMNDLWTARGRMTPSGRALLLLVLDRRKDARAAEAARELAESAQTRGDLSWWTATSDPLLDDMADTSVEATALALQALAAHEPRNPLLERVARWLVVNRTGGYWVSTKQTALALRGLLAYMRARGERAEPVDADVFVNGTRIGGHAFDAKAMTAPDPVIVEGPAAAGTNEIRIVTHGGGALYYDASVVYYDKPAAAERTGSRRLALTRSYSTLSPVRINDRIVYRESAFTGTARPGDLMLVRLTAAGSTDWRYLMLEDPIPAGTEPVERDDPFEIEGRRSWFWGVQRELRDDRVVFFLTDFTRGRYEFVYLLKVTTPGVFNAMPARIAPMYVPDVSASSTVTTVTVPAPGVP